MRINIFTILTLCVCLWTYGCSAQDTAKDPEGTPSAKGGEPQVAVKAGTAKPALPTTPKKGSDKKKKENLTPTDISSDSLEYDLEKQVIVFTGNVQVLDDQLDLKADEMTVTMNKKTREMTKISAKGRVELKKDDTRATADLAVYDLTKEEVVLSGEPVMYNPTGRFVGALKVILNRKTGKFRTEGGKPRFLIKDTGGKSPVKNFIDGPEKKDPKNTKKNGKGTVNKDAKEPEKKPAPTE